MARIVLFLTLEIVAVKFRHFNTNKEYLHLMKCKESFFSFSVKEKWIIWLIMQNQDYQGRDTLIVIFNRPITNPISSSIQTKEG